MHVNLENAIINPVIVRQSGELSAAAWAVQQLRGALDRGELLPGQQVRQKSWSVELGVSRVAIREALPVLAAEGRLEHEKNRGYFVKRPCEADIYQIFLIRRLIEPEIIKTITWPDEEALVRLNTQSTSSVEAAESGDLGAALEHSRNFIFGIWELSHLTVLVAEAKRLWSMSEPSLSAMSAHPIARDGLASSLRRRLPRLMALLADHDRDGLAAQVAADLTTAPDLAARSVPTRLGE